MKKQKDKKPIDDKISINRIGNFLAQSRLSKDQKHIEGEIYIFLGIREPDGKRGVISIQGSFVNSKFKEKVFKTAMDILLQDACADYFKPENDNT